MASRPVIIASLLGASVGVPYFAAQQGSESAHSKSAVNIPLPAATGTAPAFGGMPIVSATPSVGASPVVGGVVLPGSVASPPGGTRFQSVDQFLRFDVTKEWVYRNWERKTTGPTDVGLFSVRVPLVMGTQLSALSGSLTYFFSPQGQVEHISFYGRTGDTTQLVNFLTRTYELVRVEAPVGEQVYQVSRYGKVQSELRTRAESVVDAKSPHSNIFVELELARPGSKRYLPSRTPTLDLAQAATQALPPSTSSAASGDSYLDSVRYATPQEKGNVLWKRWPN